MVAWWCCRSISRRLAGVHVGIVNGRIINLDHPVALTLTWWLRDLANESHDVPLALTFTRQRGDVTAESPDVLLASILRWWHADEAEDSRGGPLALSLAWWLRDLGNAATMSDRTKKIYGGASYGAEILGS